MSRSPTSSNARAIVRDLRVSGPAVWDRFKAGAEGQAGYYGALGQIFEARRPGVLVDELSVLAWEMATREDS